MIKVILNEIKEIRLCWDWACAIIPSKYVRKLEFTGLKNELPKSGYECDYVFLKIDLEFLKNNNYYTGNSLDYYRKNNIPYDSEETIYESLENFNVWDIEIIYKDNTRTLLNLPYKPKSDAWSKNLWEQHQEQDNILKMLWITPNMTKEMRKGKIYESKSN